MREELPASPDQDVGAAFSGEIGCEGVGIDARGGRCIVAVPAQDVHAGAADEQVREQVRQTPLAVFHRLEEFAQVGRVDGQVGQVVLMEELELVVEVPHRLVARGRGEETAAAFPGAQEAVEHPVALAVGIAEVVAFIHQHEVPVPVATIVGHPIGAVCGILLQHPHGKHAGVELVNLVVVLPHLDQRRGTEDERAGQVTAHKVFDDGRADVGLAQAHHVGDEAAAVTLDHVRRLAHGLRLELGEDGGDVVAPQRCLGLGAGQLFVDHLVEHLEVDLVGRHLDQRPGAAKFLHQAGVEILRFIPQPLEPGGQFGVIGVARHHHVEFGVERDAGEGEVARPDDGDAALRTGNRLALCIEERSVIEDVGFGVQAAFGVDAHLEPFLFDQAHEDADEVFGLRGLIEQCGGLPDVCSGHIARLLAVGEGGMRLGFDRVAHLVEAAVALGNLLDGLAAGGVADEQSQLSHVGELVCHGFQPGEKEVPHGKPGRLAAGQGFLDLVDQIDFAIIYDVVGQRLPP